MVRSRKRYFIEDRKPAKTRDKGKDGKDMEDREWRSYSKHRQGHADIRRRWFSSESQP